MPAIWWPHGYGPPDDEIKAGKAAGRTWEVRAGGHFDPNRLRAMSRPYVVMKIQGVWKAIPESEARRYKQALFEGLADSASTESQRKTA